MSRKYSEITFNDPSIAKRWLQRKRLDIVLPFVVDKENSNTSILDYGCGNAEIFHTIKKCKIEYSGYDPSTSMIDEARENLGGQPNATLTSDLTEIKGRKYDVVFCLEVFEHLTTEGIELCLNDFRDLLNDDGVVIIGVPNEIYLSAMIRGLFRMIRRYGSYDATVKNVTKAVLGFPPEDRPWKGDSPRNTYAYPHMGFDHRKIIQLFERDFQLVQSFGSPFRALPLVFNTEVYFVLKSKREFQ